MFFSITEFREIRWINEEKGHVVDDITAVIVNFQNSRLTAPGHGEAGSIATDTTRPDLPGATNESSSSDDGDDTSPTSVVPSAASPKSASPVRPI